MFAKLALRNMRRQIKSYLIYFVTVALSVALLFAVSSLSCCDNVRQLMEIANDMSAMFTMVMVLSSVVTALVLGHATGFLLRLRKKEFGMYLTLGMTRGNIRTIFVCEIGILFLSATGVGLAAGLVIFQLLLALFSFVMEFSFEASFSSAEAVLLTVLVCAGMFLLSMLTSLRYLRRVEVTELLKEEAVQRTERHPVLWCTLALLTAAGLTASLVMTYKSLMATFTNQSAEVFIWLVLDLVMIYLAHFALARALACVLLHSRRLRNRGSNTVVLRGLGARVNTNSALIGAIATLFAFAVAMCNIAFSEKIYAEHSIQKDCPYDVLAMLSTDEASGISMEEGEAVIEKYSPITSRLFFRLYSAGETTLCSSILGYDALGITDKFMPLSQFNELMEGCGREAVTLGEEYLLITQIQGICEVDFSEKVLHQNGKAYTWAGTSTQYPDFCGRELFYFVVPDEAVAGMEVSDNCAAYTLEKKRPDAAALGKELVYYRSTPNGMEEKCDYRLQEEWRLYLSATAGTLIVGTLYVTTVFVCMALAIQSLKVLSTLEEERARFRILYRLGVDEGMQRRILRRQIGTFFLMPFVFSVAMTPFMGFVFGRVYQIWGFAGLDSFRAMETAVLISAVITLIYLLYYGITYRVACGHVTCRHA